MKAENKATRSSLTPDWLPLFPFIHSHGSTIQDLQTTFPDLADYDLNLDWEQFVADKSHLDKFAQLRQFRQSRLAYMAFQDFFLPLSKHTLTMKLVSELADFLLSQAWHRVNTEMQSRYGCIKNQNGDVATLQVFALGKLGTCELNYSSDIDLVFVHDGAGMSDGERSLDAESWFMRFGKKMIQLLDSFTSDGRVYRVDMRLRPFGSAGPLVCSKDALAQYLINEGRDWERFAWMRARLICGNEWACQSLMKEINAFIYRRHLDYKVFDALAKIKQDIALEHQVHESDLKLGFGGIRTIEFIVQSLQVVFGGRIKQLQGVAIHPQFDKLLFHKKISKDNASVLEQAWLWLRKTENLAQIVQDQDTHELPQDDDLQAVFAEILGSESWTLLISQLTGLRQSVDQIFAEIFSHPKQDEHQLNAQQQILLQTLIDELNLSRVPQDTAQKAKQLLEICLGKANREVCLDFTRVVKVLLKRPNYLLMLLKEHNVLHNVLQLLQQDSYFKDVLIRYPVLFEQLFEYQPYRALSTEHLRQDWHSLIAKETEVELWMEQLRYFKLIHQFNLMRFYQAGEISVSEFKQQLTGLAEFILNLVVGFSHKEIKAKLTDVSISPRDLMVIAYGSMAVRGMKITSDLDLVFVLDSQLISPDDRVFLHRWIKRIMHHLNSQMYHGLLYEIDLQLRPNGQSGPLITTQVEFEHYQQTEAWTWEHAAMVKSRLVYGTKAQKQWHHQFRKSILCQSRVAAKVDTDLQLMADKLAAAHRNKAHEADFALLGAVLKFAHYHPQLADVYDLDELQAQVEEIKKPG